MLSIFISVSILLSATTNVLCHTKTPCELTDDDCVTEGSNYYRDIVSGKPDIGVDSSDPIHLDLVEVTLPTINYTLSDVYFHGMKDCRVDKWNLNFKEMASNLNLICPLLTLESNYYAEGHIDSIFIEGKGKSKGVHDDYYIGVRMNVENVKGADGKPHLNIKSFVLNPLEVRGRVVYDLENLYNGDKDKSEATHKYLNENWKAVSGAIEAPAMNSLIGKFVENLNKSFKAVSINEMFYKHV